MTSRYPLVLNGTSIQELQTGDTLADVGDVTGPASSTDNAVARFDSTTGKIIQNSAVTIADTTGDITGGKYNGITFTTSTGTFTLTNGKTFAVQAGLTLAGTDSTTMTFPGTSQTVAGLGVSSQIFTTAQTFRAASAVRSEAASTQDAVILAGRAGGTNSYAITLTPTTLSGNQTITFPDATGTVGLLGTPQTWTAVQTLTDPALIGTVLEDIYTISDGAAFEVDPGNGSIQLITLGASRTPKATNFTAGEAITLMVDDGSAYTITWTDATWGASGVVWLTDSGVAPTLATTGYTAIVLWKVSTQVYGARVGNNAQ